ncbi:hypothetical protein C8J31_11486 [Rhizobium sp. PP-CC-2G-626]|nr:hypothetical protein C8J31_11486 [Rhizobium sp. PP-CC-2G-626]
MNHQFIIDTIHERRVGIDMITMPFAQETFYAEPDDLEGFEGDDGSGGYQIPSDRE